MEIREFIIGRDYVDKGSKTHPDDQFLKWFNIENMCIPNASGIRVLRFKERSELNMPAFIILVTNTSKTSTSYHNPWEDIIDFSSGTIFYWGDAKFDEKKKGDDFRGNLLMKRVNELVLEKKYGDVPPILHFTKPERGKVVFNGLCVIENMEYSWIEDKNKPVRNYKFELKILDTQTVSQEWIKQRVLHKENSLAPVSWKKYSKTGIKNVLKLWRKSILSKEQQVPGKKSDDYKILIEICKLDPFEFERFAVELMKEIEMEHTILQTKKTADGGFDFFGYFKLPYPINYKIDIKGEVKKFNPEKAVQPKHVSRLVARLIRGEFGIFMTTSYFTRQCQEEVISDGYPVKLFSGIDIINFLKEYNFLTGKKLNKKFYEVIKNG